MANERTALAWVRTALALIAGGVALTSLARVADLGRLLDVVAILLCLAGAGAAVAGAGGWYRRERALRAGAPLPAPSALVWLMAVVVLAGLLLAGYVGIAWVDGDR
jgi:putative membrane protein